MITIRIQNVFTTHIYPGRVRVGDMSTRCLGLKKPGLKARNTHEKSPHPTTAPKLLLTQALPYKCEPKFMEVEEAGI